MGWLRWCCSTDSKRIQMCPALKNLLGVKFSDRGFTTTQLRWELLTSLTVQRVLQGQAVSLWSKALTGRWFALGSCGPATAHRSCSRRGDQFGEQTYSNIFCLHLEEMPPEVKQPVSQLSKPPIFRIWCWLSFFLMKIQKLVMAKVVWGCLCHSSQSWQ